MLRDITIGQYYDAQSVIHRLDARTKLILTIVYAVTLFFCNDIWLFALASIFLIIYIGLCHVPLTFMLKGLKVVWFFILFTAIFSLFGGQGNILWEFGVLRITEEGLVTTLKITIRLVYLILGSAVMTYTTMPVSLASGIESLLGFLKVFHVPVAEMAMMLSIALRFIPIFMEELDKIMKAQMSRGADFETGNIFKRIKYYIPVFVPLFVSAIRRANELAEAMDARCFHGGDDRTRMNPLQYHATDIVTYGILACYVVGIILYRVI